LKKERMEQLKPEMRDKGGKGQRDREHFPRPWEGGGNHRCEKRREVRDGQINSPKQVSKIEGSPVAVQNSKIKKNGGDTKHSQFRWHVSLIATLPQRHTFPEKEGRKNYKSTLLAPWF